MSKITVEASIPDELLQEFLQHLRNFDTSHSGRMHLEIGIEARGLSKSDVQQIFSSVRPPFAQQIIMQGKADA